MDRLVSITAFVRVAESGGFTAAARRLNLPTTAVSERVQALENVLGVRLLNRTTRQVSLTEIGHEYYERCVQILEELDEADRVVGALQLLTHHLATTGPSSMPAVTSWWRACRAT
jgi:DNA-binding transcriptional LysR family regulator